MPYPFEKKPNLQTVKDVLNSDEAAKYLLMHVKTIRRLAKEGKIPAKRVSNKWRFLRSSLDNWLAETLI